MSKLTVIVVGHQKTGKSTIASIIALALRGRGFTVEHPDDKRLGVGVGMPEYMLQPRVEALLEKKTEISVREVDA